MACEGKKFLAGNGVPDFRCLVYARRRQAPAIRAERHARDTAGVALESEKLLAGAAVPDLGSVVLARRRQAPASPD